MAMRSTLRLVLLLLLFQAAGPVGEAYAACGGMPTGPCTPYWWADVVFVGEVEAIAAAPSNLRGDRQVDVHLRVLEGFRGIAGSTAVVRDALSSETTQWRQGAAFFVYASRDSEDGLLYASTCASRELAQAQADLEYARWIRGRPDGGRLIASVYHEQWDPLRDESVQFPFPGGITITMTGPGGSWSAVPTANGAFGHFTLDVPLGTYESRVDAEGAYVADETGPIEIGEPDRCVRTSIRLRTPGTVRGRLVDAEGRPVPHCTLTFVASRSIRAGRQGWEESLGTDENGEFVHRLLGPGEYIVGVHLDRGARGNAGPPFFFPGVPDVASAQSVAVTVGAEVDLGDFMLPVSVEKALLEGLVIMPDGSPADAAVRLASDEASFDLAEMLVRADASGRFSVYVVRGRRYHATVHVIDDDLLLSGGADVVGGGSGPVTVRLRASP